MVSQSILDKWKLTADEFTEIVAENPSLRGFILGYVGEYKLRKMLLEHPLVQTISKPDDHSRGRGKKNDLTVTYRNHLFTIEVKSLQTNSIRRTEQGFQGSVQVDASDRRPVRLSDGAMLETTCLLRGEFDVLAINLFQFRELWEFAFILNQDLPPSRSKKYTDIQRAQLLATSIQITQPIQMPYSATPFALFDALIDAEE